MSEAPSFAAQALGMVIALVLVLGLAWLLLALLKRWQFGRPPAGDASAQLVGSVALGPRERIVTLRWRGCDYLLGVTPAAIQVIDQRETPTELVKTASATPPAVD